MNTDTRYGRGDIRFTMNISWFDHELLYECGGYSEREDNDETKMEEFYAMVEAEIGDYLDCKTMRKSDIYDANPVSDHLIWDYLSSIAKVMEEIDRYYVQEDN